MKHKRTSRMLFGILLLATSMVVVYAGTASSTGATVARGELHAFAAGTGLDISGHAQLVRRPSGSTFVALHVNGLRPGGQYASHVHKAPCQVGDADGHFQQHGPGAGPTPPNEIWPGDGPWTANDAGDANVNTTAGYIANADAVSVVVHDLSLPSTANKVACANLD